MKVGETKEQRLKLSHGEMLYKTTFPVLTPHYCSSCKTNYNFERMWVFLSGPWFSMRGVYRYVCQRCAKTDVEVKAIFDEISGKSKPPVTPGISTTDQPSNTATKNEKKLEIDPGTIEVELNGVPLNNLNAEQKKEIWKSLDK